MAPQLNKIEALTKWLMSVYPVEAIASPERYFQALVLDAGDLLSRPGWDAAEDRWVAINMAMSLRTAIDDYQAMLKNISAYLVSRCAYDFCEWALSEKRICVDIGCLRSWIRVVLPDSMLVYDAAMVAEFRSVFPQWIVKDSEVGNEIPLTEEDLKKMLDLMAERIKLPVSEGAPAVVAECAVQEAPKK